MMVNDPHTVAELEALNARYERALMTNDVEALDDMFWHSPHVVRLGVGENLYGIDEIAAFRAARPGGAPQRTVVNSHITAFGTGIGIINLEFQRASGGPIGRQSQTWVKFPKGWKIVSAHVSLMSGSH